MDDACDRCVPLSSERRSPLSLRFSLRQPTSISFAQTFPPHHINTTVRYVSGWPASASSSPSPPFPAASSSSHRSRRPAARLPPARGLGWAPQGPVRPGLAARPSAAPLSPAAGEVSAMQIVGGPTVCFIQPPGPGLLRPSEVARIKN